MAKKEVFKDILIEAINEPGIISAAFSQFHNYSLGNIMNVAVSAHIEGIKFGPMAPEKKWNELGRTKIEGSSKFWISVPKSGKCKVCKGTRINPDMQLGDITPDCPKCNGRGGFRYFKWLKCILVLDQTEGDEYELQEPPDWNLQSCLKELKIELKDFDSSGNTGGTSAIQDNKISINRLHPNQINIAFHEIAHQVLHTKGKERPNEAWIREVEAETTAYICAKSLGCDGLEESRGYIQHWLEEREITDQMAQNIFSTANTILKAGI